MPSTTQSIHDLAIEMSHQVTMMFYPPAWRVVANGSLTWNKNPFPPILQSDIPNSPGVYAFVVTPNLFDFPAASGLFYIGKATNLYSRISAYIQEIDKEFRLSRRPQIWRMINQWHGYLTYYYTVTQTVAAAEALETEMLDTFRPYFNRQFSAEVGHNTRAF